MDAFRYWCSEYWPALAIAAAMVLLFVVAVVMTGREANAFMEECAAEGYSPFQCKVLHKQAHPPAPVVIHH